MMDQTLTRISSVLEKFQKAAASKSVLEEQVSSLTAEVAKLEAELNQGLLSLGYNPGAGQSVDDFLLQVSQGIEAELQQYEKALA
jgi:hypothetical protein